MNLSFNIGGDMFKHVEDDSSTIVVTVNCVGVMGKGVARQAKHHAPELNQEYIGLCKENKVKPGVPFTLTDRKWLLFPTKNHWRYNSRYSWIRQGLKRIAEHADSLKGRKILMTLPGCGNGNLEPYRIHKMVFETLKDTDLDITLYMTAWQRDEIHEMNRVACQRTAIALGRWALAGGNSQWVQDAPKPILTDEEVEWIEGIVA